ncbi:MAG: lasso peptide biosynthesis B2 protein [Acidobacteriota bacterium]
MSRAAAAAQAASTRLLQGLFGLGALPAVARASCRLFRHRQESLDQLAVRMRSVRTWSARSPRRRRPRALAAVVRRLESWLPPWGYGRCFKRSMLLLDLWSRCGLEPTLHLGTRRDRTDRLFHAWVTTSGDGPRTPDGGHEEIWSG